MSKKKGSGGFFGFLILLVAMIAIVKVGAALIKWAFALSILAVLVVVIAVIVLAMKTGNKKDPNVEMSDNQNPAMKKRPSSGNGPTVVPPAGTEEPEPAGPKLTVEQENILSKGRTNLLELRKIITKIKDPEIHQMSNEICDVNEKILKTLREKPEKIPQVRQFLNYYLPTLGEILVKYERIEKSGVPAEKSEKKVEKYLADIKKAMEKQYENLYDDDKLDLSVEMEAMTMAAKSDGLISDEDYKVESGEHEITLTL